VIIYRYYDKASTLFGTARRRKSRNSRTGLSDLILRVRELVCGNPKNKVTGRNSVLPRWRTRWRLVCRAFLQTPSSAKDEARRASTSSSRRHAAQRNRWPGINGPAFWPQHTNNFNRSGCEYLDYRAALQENSARRLDSGRGVSLGANLLHGRHSRGDYDVAAGLSRTFAGNGSDGSCESRTPRYGA